jgi:uncharacterized iron-regulated protein
MRVFKAIKKVTVFSFLGLTWSLNSSAQQMYDAKTLTTTTATKLSIEEFTSKIPKGAIIVIGEIHNYLPIQQGQLAILNSLRAQGHKINMGFEYLKYTDQSNVDAFRNGTMSETDFKKSSWGDADFNFYRDQILFPNAENDETTFAINSPKEIPLIVKEKGIAGLSEEEKALLPPNFQLGRYSYKERFVNLMKLHVKNEEQMARYFETQSVWDDTMAWKACESAESSENTFVMVVGLSHVEYGDGLVDRMRSRCGQNRPIITVYQYLFYNDEAVEFTSFLPSERYGVLADYLMIVRKD